MNDIGMLLLVVAAMACLLALPVSILVRLGFLPFSKRVRGQVRKHPFLHTFWFLTAAAVFFLVFVLTGSDRSKRKGSSNQASQPIAAGAAQAER